MIHHELIQKIDLKKPESWLATWFGCGLLTPAPGTWGTIGGLPFGVLMMIYGGWPALLVGLAILLPIGWWACARVEAMTGDHDGGYIVIDEVAGVWIALLGAATNPLAIACAFISFRLFDIWKPWPCNYLDQKLSGAHSVMLDDMAAGLYAALVTGGLFHVFS